MNTRQGRNEILEMRFDPSTIQHLGVQMYYTLPPVIAEIVANSYDADANKVTIYLKDKSTREIVIEDDGHGMDWKELNPKFLLIGRNRRKEGNQSPGKNGKKRLVIGKKGLGKLSFFGIADEIVVETVKGSERNKFLMSMEDIRKEKSGIYRPKIIEKGKKTNHSPGTRIILRRLKRKSSFNPQDLAVALARTFSVFDEEDFNVQIVHNGKPAVTLRNELKYEGIVPLKEFMPPLRGIGENYSETARIKGKIIVAKDTTIPTAMRGIALFSRGKLVNEYSFYDVKSTSHGYSYITGDLDVSFIDTWKKDVISTNRRSLNWEDEDAEKLKGYLNDLIYHVYNEQRRLRRKDKIEKVKQKTGVDIEQWVQELPKHEKKLAKQLTDNILNSEGLDDDKAADLLSYVQDSFQYESFKELAAELEGIKEISSEGMLSLLKEWKVIEAREFYKLSLVRIQTIKKFDTYIDQNAKEVPTLHNFFKSFGWLLDPRIIEFEDEVKYSDLLRKKFTEKHVKLESNKRIDFLCTGIANTFIIIELKRPHHVLTQKDILQANEYADFVEKHVGTDKFTTKQIITYIVCGKKSESGAVQRLVRTHEQAGNVYIKTYLELLTAAQKYHQEFIKKYDDFREADTRKRKR